VKRTRTSPVAALLDGLAGQLRADLGRNIVGLYVYGSLTQGAFDPRRSDVDCVAVTRRPLSPLGVSRLRAGLRRLRLRDPWMRRLQLTILIQRELLQNTGDGWLYQFGRLIRTGSDGNPIIWANVLESGHVVFGAAPRTFVPRITPALMRAALQREVGYLRAELITQRDSAWRERPAYRRYAVLTLCRILYTRATGRVGSKRSAATWAIRRLPAGHRPTVRRALARPARARLIPLRPLRALLLHVERWLAAPRRGRSHPVRRHHDPNEIALTLFAPGDVPVLFEADADGEHRRRFDFPDGFVPSREHSENVITRWARERLAGVRFAYAVRSVAGGELVGGCELRPLGDGAANLSYWTYPRHRRRGVASRAVALACRIARTEFDFRGLEIVVDPDNVPSRRVATRNGFEEAGEKDGRVLYTLVLGDRSARNP
jgi:RimJ/RimL family protein N-acetyltransferase